MRQRYGHTQNLEELYITQNLGSVPRGRFLDIGAHDGLSFSSTRALVEKGWSGVYVEPDPYVLPALVSNTEDFKDRTTIEPVAIGLERGHLPFYSSKGDMVGSLSQAHKIKWSSAVSFEEIQVDVITLDDLAQKHGTNFDFINLDVEGINWELFTQFDWNVWTPKVVCIEYDDKLREIGHILENNGFTISYVSPENIVAVKRQ
jgi:FkbM family methyltransferase